MTGTFPEHYRFVMFGWRKARGQGKFPGMGDGLRIDESGRLVVPKTVQKYFGLKPGDKLVVRSDENGPRPDRAGARSKLALKGKTLVLRGAIAAGTTVQEIDALIDQGRERRMEFVRK